MSSSVQTCSKRAGEATKIARDLVRADLGVKIDRLFLPHEEAQRWPQLAVSDAGASFTYDPSYLADRRAYPLDPALPLLSGTLQTRLTSAPSARSPTAVPIAGDND